MVTRPHAVLWICMVIVIFFFGSISAFARTSPSFKLGARNFTFDSGDRLTGVTSPDGVTLAYTYDGPLTKSVTWSGVIAGSVGYAYDNDFRLSSFTVNGGAAVTYAYDADSLLTKAGDLTLSRSASTGFITGTALGVTSDAYQYSGYGETASYAATAASQEVYRVSYTRDSLGRIESENEVVEGVATQWAYRYDTAGRLVEVLKDGASWSVYRYDSNGNRIEAATQSGLVNGTYDAQDRLLTYGNFVYEYTSNGELKTKTDTTSGAVTRYAYDIFGNLTRVDLPDGRIIEYVIDGANRRVGKKVNGVLVKGWLYKDSLKPIAELDGSGNVIATFIYGSKYNTPDYVIKGGVTYRIVSDHLGSPRLSVDSATGAITAKMDYDEFGIVLTDNNVGFTPFGFAGGLYDADTGLTRFGARDYDPASGRWTAKDPIRFDSKNDNLYDYATNDPINYTDIDGKYAALAPSLAEGAVLLCMRYPSACRALLPIFYCALFPAKCQLSCPVPDSPLMNEDSSGKQRRNTPATGEPNTAKDFPDGKEGKTNRQYGPDGKARKDVDYGHDHGHGDPHVHDWDWNKKRPRGEGRPPEPGEL